MMILMAPLNFPCAASRLPYLPHLEFVQLAQHPASGSLQFLSPPYFSVPCRVEQMHGPSNCIMFFLAPLISLYGAPHLL